MRTLTEVFAAGASTLPEGLRTLVVSPEREVEPGVTVRAAFTFRNQGGAPATGVRVRFNVPDGLVYLVGTGTLDGRDLDDELGNSPLLARAGADIGDVAPGEERRIELAYSVAGAIENGSTIELQAAVAAFELPPVGSNVVRLAVRSRPQLENALTTVSLDAPLHPKPGSEATVTVRVHNAGESSAHDVLARAPVPERTSYVPLSARLNGRECGSDASRAFESTGTALLADMLPASATATFSYRVRIDAPLRDRTNVAANATVASQETAAFALAQSAIEVRAAAEFSEERATLETQPPYEIAAGERVDVRLRAANDGTTAAQNVTVAVQFPPNVLAVRGAARCNGRPLRERKRDSFVYDLGGIEANETIEFAAQAMVPAPQEDGAAVAIAVVLAWDGAEGERAERRFERTLTVRAQPAFTPSRTRLERPGPARVRAGEECEASLVLANDGSAAATDVVVSLVPDDALDDVRLFEQKSRVSLENGDAALGTLESGAVRRFTVRARVRAPQTNGTAVRLAASVHTQQLGETSLGEITWNVASSAVFDAASSRLQLAGEREVRPNQLADVFVTLHNDGTDAARDVRLRLYLSPEARIDAVEGAARERAVLLFGEIAAGARAQARLTLRLLRGLARAHPVTLDAVLSASGILPVQLERLSIATAAEPDFSVGSFAASPAESVDAGECVEYVLHVRNGGDGPARSARICVEPDETLVYVPNSTTVNDVPLRDAGAQSPVMSEGGILLSDVDPGVEATVRWREVVHGHAPAGASVARTASVRYDGDRVDEIRAPELKVRSAPAFATTIAGLPFGLDGVAGAGSAYAQTALTEERFVELPPATPVVMAAAIEIPASPAPLAIDGGQGAGTMVFLPPERLARVLRLLDEARFGGIVTHLFAIRAFLPDRIGAAPAPWLDAQRASLRETLDRLFIKLRLPNYAIAPRDLETQTARDTLRTFLRSAAGAAGVPASAGDGPAVTGSVDVRALERQLELVESAPLATAAPWAALAACLPNAEPEWANYQEILGGVLGDASEAAPEDFIDLVQRKPHPVLDAALGVVRARLCAV